MPRKDTRVEDRFLSYVKKEESCWIWQGGMRTKYYGGFSLEGSRWYAHRAAFHIFNGGLKKSSVVHHKCGNSVCVNPEHLQAVTPAQNTVEMVERRSYIHTIKNLEKEVTELKKELEERDKV